MKLPIIYFLIFLVYLFSSSQITKAITPYNVNNYDINLKIDVKSQTLSGKVSINLTSQQEGLTEIKLDALKLNIDKVCKDEIPQKFKNTDKQLIIFLSTPMKQNEERTLTIVYSCSSSSGLYFFSDHVYTAYDTKSWLVCNFHPSDKASFNLTLTVPSKLEKVVASGQLIDKKQLSNNNVQYIWQQNSPIPAYVFGFAAGAFQEIIESTHGTQLRFLTRHLSRKKVQKIFTDTSDILEFFEECSGEKYSGKSYTQVLVSGEPMQEVDNFSLLYEDYAQEVLKEKRNNWLIVHEFAHQWWGNKVTCKNWSDFWLNEGLATFMTAAYKEHRFGRDEYNREIKLSRELYLKAQTQNKDRPLAYKDEIEEEKAGGPIVYHKGALIFHLLRFQLGEEKFWKGIRLYTQKNFGGSTTTSDLQDAFEQASAQSLADFFDHWIYKTDVPVISAHHELKNGKLIVTIEQEQKEIWPIPIVITIKTLEGKQTQRISLNSRREKVIFTVSSAILSVIIDDEGNLPITINHSRPEVQSLK